MRSRNYELEWWLVGIAIFVVLISIIGDYYSTDLNLFTRSGSIVVLLAAIVEFKISPHIYEDIQRAQYIQSQVKPPVPIKAKPTKSNRKISFTAHVLLIVGTMIWGYGDLLWP